MFPSLTAPERRADFVIHLIGLVGLSIAGGFLFAKVVMLDGTVLVLATLVYWVTAIVSIAVSFAYHLLPRHEWRAILRRWDHAAIYTAMAGVFTPLLVAAGTPSARIILALIWAIACLGGWFKLSGDNGDSRWSLISYLGLGAFALLSLPDLWAQLPPLSTYAVGAGTTFYAIGTLFYRKRGSPFRYPIWHSFGTLGGTSFFVSVWVAVAG
ncbi:MAG: hemolysin III family protein [Pseudomonadota bacterium]